MPIPKLLIQISLPLIISMIVQALYNVVDSIFVAQISEDALTAVSLAFPIQNLMIAVAAGTGVGINALAARYLGEKDLNKASLVCKNGLVLAVLSWILFVLIGVFATDLFYQTQTDDAAILTYGKSYMYIICLFSFGVFFQITFERFLHATGKTHLSMIVQGIGALVNIILDPILIFGMFGLPRMEVAGAALATIIGQIIGASVGLFICIFHNREINLNFKKFLPSKEYILAIYRIGFPAIIMQSIGSIMVFGFNTILLMFSSTAAAVFGVYFKLQSFIFMPVFGLTSGLISIVAYNFGARDKKRIMHTYRLSCYIAISIMLLGLVIFQIFPRELLAMFDASPEMIEIGVVALRSISVSFPFAGYCICTSCFFQAVGFSMYSLITSVARQLLALLPLAYILATYMGLHHIWWSFPLAEIFSVASSLFLVRRIYTKEIKHL